MGSPESRYMRRGRLSRGLGRRLSGTGVSVGLEVGAMVACFGSLRAVTASELASAAQADAACASWLCL